MGSINLSCTALHCHPLNHTCKHICRCRNCTIMHCTPVNHTYKHICRCRKCTTMHCTVLKCPSVRDRKCLWIQECFSHRSLLYNLCHYWTYCVHTREVMTGHMGHYYTVCVTTGHIVDTQEQSSLNKRVIITKFVSLLNILWTHKSSPPWTHGSLLHSLCHYWTHKSSPH